MSKIFRYALEITDYQEISVPSNHKVLSCAPARSTYEAPWGPEQGIDLWVWVDQNPDHGFTTLRLWAVGTGNPMPTDIAMDRIYFVGTCVMTDGLVWHLFATTIR